MRFSRLGVYIVAASAVTTTVLASPAMAAGPIQPDAVNESLSYVANQTVLATVPSGVCGATFNVRGGSGGGPSLVSMSAGGEVTGTLVLTAGQVITLNAGSSADLDQGGLGGYAPGGDGYTQGATLNYGGGAASGLGIQGVGVIAVAGGGGGYGALGDLGGAGGGGVAGAGADGANSGGAGGTVAMSGSSSGGTGVSRSSAGGGAGYSGGSASTTAGGAAGGGSNYFNNGYANASLGLNHAYSAAAGGYAAVAYQACAAPSAPASLTVTPNGTSATLSFPRSVDNGSPVTGYQYSLDGGLNWNSLTTTGTTTKSATISSLTLGTNYNIDVRATYLTAAINANQGGGTQDFSAGVSSSFTASAASLATPSTSLSSTGLDYLVPLMTSLGLGLAGAFTLIATRLRRRTK